MNTINDQIVDSVNYLNTTLSGQSPSSSMGILDAVMAETIGMAMHNAVTAQQNGQMIGNASVTATCARILSVQIGGQTTTGGTTQPTPIGPLQPTVNTVISTANSQATSAINTLLGIQNASAGSSSVVASDLKTLSALASSGQVASGAVTTSTTATPSS